MTDWPITFSIDRHPQAQIRLTGLPGTSSVSGDVYNDPNFARRFDFYREPADMDALGGAGSHHSAGSTSSATHTEPSTFAQERLAAYGFDISASGLISPAAPAITDPEMRMIIDSMHSILDEYLAAHPGERTIVVGLTGLLPGPDADSNIIATSTGESTINTLLHFSLGGLINPVMALCTRAACWYENQHGDQGHTNSPVPLDRPLTFVDSKGNIEAQNEEATRVRPDFLVKYGSAEIGTLESKPFFKARHAGILPEPRLNPLDTDRCLLADHADTTGFVGAYGTHHWWQKLLLQLSSQLYLHNVTTGLLLGDHGRLLLAYQLLPKRADPPFQPNPEDGRPTEYILTFASVGLWSQVPTQDAGDLRVHAVSATEAAAAAASSASEPKVRFDSTPGIPWAIMHYMMYMYHQHKQGQRPRHADAHGAPTFVKPLVSIGQGPSSSLSSSQREPSQEPFQLPQLPRDQRQESLRGQHARQNAFDYSEPLTTASSIHLLVMPSPLTWGTFANVYRCLLNPVRNAGGEVRLNAFENSPLLKVHRPPRDHDADQERGTSTLPMADVSLPPAVAHETATDRDRNVIVKEILARVDNEMRVYHHLACLQGDEIPRLLGTVAPEYPPVSHGTKLILENAGITVAKLYAKRPEVFRTWSQVIAEGIKRTIRQCHRARVAHGDISASNVLIAWTASPEADDECEECDDNDEEEHQSNHNSSDDAHRHQYSRRRHLSLDEVYQRSSELRPADTGSLCPRKRQVSAVSTTSSDDSPVVPLTPRSELSVRVKSRPRSSHRPDSSLSATDEGEDEHGVNLSIAMRDRDLGSAGADLQEQPARGDHVSPSLDQPHTGTDRGTSSEDRCLKPNSPFALPKAHADGNQIRQTSLIESQLGLRLRVTLIDWSDAVMAPTGSTGVASEVLRRAQSGDMIAVNELLAWVLSR